MGGTAKRRMGSFEGSQLRHLIRRHRTSVNTDGKLDAGCNWLLLIFPILRFPVARALPASMSLCLVLLLTSSTLAQQDSWKQALPGYQFRFPRDHASHPDYKIEWWYYTGNLSAENGRRFGYQITFFRIGVDAKPANPSRWAVRDLFMTHLAVTDIDGGKYEFAERINRSGVGWAG